MEERKPKEAIRLTQFSHGSGCGCKIAPEDLKRIIEDARTSSDEVHLLIGNHTSDDAAVIDIGEGRALISTTDFFMPIVDYAIDFGKIAAANAISDVYAMGGKPLTAIAILGWPIEMLGTDSAKEVLSGAKMICNEAGISLSGGHSIESKEPFFGLSVTGIIAHENIKTNAGAKSGDLIYITKPIGVGIITTALKRGLASRAEVELATSTMVKLNNIGEYLGSEKAVNALTDVTGFGVLGHLIEMCEGAQLSAEIEFGRIPLIDHTVLEAYLNKFVMPDNTMRNFKAFSSKVSKLNARQLQLLCDPQTNGGLLLAVDPNNKSLIENILRENDCYFAPIGLFTDHNETLVKVL